MSAVISFKAEDGVILFTDRAVYDDRYIVRDFKQKVAVAKQAPLAVATRGSDHWCDLVAETIVEWADAVGVDEALATFAEGAPGIYTFDPEMDNHLEVVIGCVSPATGPQIRVFRNISVGTQPAGVLVDAGNFYLGCASDGSGNPKPRRQAPGEDVISYISDIGTMLMEHFRSLRIPASDWDKYGRPKYIVGGGVDMTIVNGGGVEVRSVTSWPDKIGEEIDPFARTGNVFAMTRHQRRMLGCEQRQARKLLLSPA